MYNITACLHKRINKRLYEGTTMADKATVKVYALLVSGQKSGVSHNAANRNILRWLNTPDGKRIAGGAKQEPNKK